MKEIGHFIKQIRKKNKLKQSDLAGVANTGLRFISDLENGKYTCQIGKVLHILNTLGINIYLDIRKNN